MKGWNLARASLSSAATYAAAAASSLTPASSHRARFEDDVGGEAEHADLEAGGDGNDKFNKQALRLSLKELMRQQSFRILDLFKTWDEDGSGEVDRKEFRRAMKSLGFTADNAEIDAVFAEFDTDGGGTIEFAELAKALRGTAGGESTLDAALQPGAVGLGKTGMQHKLRSKDDVAMKRTKLGNVQIDLSSDVPVQQQLREILAANAVRVIDLFREWDDDGSGTIDQKEFRQALRAMGVDAEPEHVNALFDSFDDDGGGTIEYAELARGLRAGQEIDAELDVLLKEDAIARKGTTELGALAKGSFTSRPGSSPAGQRSGNRRSYSSRFSTGGSSAGGRSKGGRTDASSLSLPLDDMAPRCYAEMVWRDSQRSPSWREYILNLQVFKMKEAKDRALPMTKAVRSPRHLQERKERLVPPAKPKSKKKKKKQAADTKWIVAEERPLTCCDRLRACWQGVMDAVNAILEGFAEQDLEVQIVILIVAISGCVNTYSAAAKLIHDQMDGFDPGHAPPAPPTLPDWTVRASGAAMNYALSDPLTYLLIDYGIAVVIGVLYFFDDDIKQWQKARELERRNREMQEGGYETLDGPSRNHHQSQPLTSKPEDAAAKTASIVKGWRSAAGVAPALPSARSRAAALVDPEDGDAPPFALKTESDVRAELTRVSDRVEVLEMKLKVRTAAEFASDDLDALAQRIDLHCERQKLLKEALKHMAGDDDDEKDKEGTSEVEPKAAAPPKSVGLLSESQMNLISAILTVLKNSANGFISVAMFFADVSSDIAVIVLLWNTGNYVWAAQAIFFVVYQFVVVYQRVLPYMINTFGERSCLTLSFTYVGFPMGLLVLDFLMLLEPFGLLAVLPLPAWLKQFVPAYKATRVITEIAIESLPQCLLQSFILVVVIQQVGAGTASPSIAAMYDDARVMPQSITISTIAILKTWIEIVQQSREAGISVGTKAQQLWHVGAGLPLDALKKGSIVEWAYAGAEPLTTAEISPLLDALTKNTSLKRLNLAESGLEWVAAEATAHPLAEAMGKGGSAAALSGLQTLIISKASQFAIPIGELRAGPERALAALEKMAFFAPGGGNGPWYADILLCGDVLRLSHNRKVVSENEQETVDEVAKLLEDAKNGDDTPEERAQWERRTKQLMAKGDLRRAALCSLVGAECLRDVGFKASELIEVGFSLFELKDGLFTVAELVEAGIAVPRIFETRYTPSEMHEGGVAAAQLRPLGVAPHMMRDGGYTADEMRASYSPSSAAGSGSEQHGASVHGGSVEHGGRRIINKNSGGSALAGYPLEELKGVYTAAELKEADIPAVEVRKAGFDVRELKAANWAPEVLRKGGFTATELRTGGYTTGQVCGAGYSAIEATAAGWALEQMKRAGYEAPGLRAAKHTAKAMREAGFTPAEMRSAQYPTQELYHAGYECEELRKAGTPISELMAAGATIAEMRASGISAGGLKIENIRLKDMRLGGYTAKEIKAAGYAADQAKKAGYVEGLKMGGYTIGEAVAVGYSCEELFRAGYAADEMLASGFAPLEMRVVGYDAKMMQAAGVTLPKLRAAGVSVGDLRGAGFTCEELRLVGVTAEQQQQAGASAQELKAAAFPLSDIYALFSVRELRDCGFTCEELRLVGFKASEVLSAGANKRELRDGGYTAGELREVGASAKELKALKFTSSELKECGYKARELVNVGFDSYALKMGGYRPRHVKECGFKGSSVFTLAELKADGFGVKELWHDEGFSLNLLSKCFTVENLRVDGDVKAEELLDVGFSLTEMRAGGYECAELYKAGYAVGDMKVAGYTCAEVHDAGFVEGLKAAGYTCKEARAAGYGENLKRAGYSVKDLKGAGCTFLECKNAGYIRGLKEAGYTCREAKNARFPAKMLRAAGFSCVEARENGYVADLKVAGYSVKEAQAAGCTIDEIKEAGYVEGVRAAGYTVEECFDAIFSCDEARRAGFIEGIKAAGYTIKEAKIGGFRGEQLRQAGYTLEDMFSAGFSCKEAKEAKFSAKEARQAGYTWEQIKGAGYVQRQHDNNSSRNFIEQASPNARRAAAPAPAPAQPAPAKVARPGRPRGLREVLEC